MNNPGTSDDWASAEFSDVYRIESDFGVRVDAEFDQMIGALLEDGATLMSTAVVYTVLVMLTW